jgi:hypothetical protein
VQKEVLRGLFICPTVTGGIGPIKIVIEEVEPKVAEVDSEAGKEFKTKDICRYSL